MASLEIYFHAQKNFGSTYKCFGLLRKSLTASVIKGLNFIEFPTSLKKFSPCLQIFEKLHDLLNSFLASFNIFGVSIKLLG